MATFTTKLTKRDVVLLYLVIIVALLFVFVRYIYTPFADEINDLDTKITAAEDTEFAMRTIVAMLPSQRDSARRNLELITDLTGDFYEPMVNWQIDDLFTQLLFSFSLEPVSFTLSGESDAVPGIFGSRSIEPYIYSELKQSGAGAVLSDITVASVKLSAEGEYTDIMSLLDSLFDKLPSMRVTSYSVSQKDSVWVLTLETELYMMENGSAE